MWARCERYCLEEYKTKTCRAWQWEMLLSITSAGPAERTSKCRRYDAASPVFEVPQAPDEQLTLTVNDHEDAEVPAVVVGRCIPDVHRLVTMDLLEVAPRGEEEYSLPLQPLVFDPGPPMRFPPAMLTAAQISTTHNGIPSKPLHYEAGGQTKWPSTCSHTGGAGQGQLLWWRIQFADGEAHHVSRLDLFNREDCCQHRLNGAIVWLDPLSCAKVSYS